MSITWRGLGFLGFIIPMLSYLVASLITPLMTGKAHYTTALIMFLISAAIVWFLGKHLNRDAQNDEQVPYLCMGMKLQNSAVFSLVAAVLTQL